AAAERAATATIASATRTRGAATFARRSGVTARSVGRRLDRGQDRRDRDVLGLEALDEDLDHDRVELRAGAADELVDRGLRGQARSVCAVAQHRVVRVGDEQDPRPDRDLLAGEVVWVAGAVPALVVVEHPARDRLDAERL